MDVPLYVKEDNEMVLVIEGDEPGYINMKDIPGYSDKFSKQNKFSKQTTRLRLKDVNDIINAKGFHPIVWDTVASLRDKKEQRGPWRRAILYPR